MRPRVALIDEEAARTWFPNQDPIGHQFRDLSPNTGHPWATIVGIVRPVIFDRIVRTDVYPVAYFAQAQDPRTLSLDRDAHARRIRRVSSISRAPPCTACTRTSRFIAS